MPFDVSSKRVDDCHADSVVTLIIEYKGVNECLSKFYYAFTAA